jgi:hypothetical protein
MQKHANLGASKAHRWLHCPASVAIESTIPDTSSFYAEEGTAAHSLAEMCLESQQPPESYIGVEVDGFMVDKIMAYHVAEYVDYCNAIEGKKFYELRVDYSDYAEGGFGTADCVVQQANVLHVIDLKYGSGVKVSAQQNEQLMMYAVGALMSEKIKKVDTVYMTIVQPRMDNIDTYKLAAKDVLKWAEEIVRPAAIKATQPDAEFKPSTKACRFCKAKSVCRALARHNYETTLSNFDNLNEPLVVQVPTSLTPHELGLLVPKMAPLISWARAIEAHAKKVLDSGGIVDGYKLVAGRNRRSWADEAEAQKVLKELIGDEVVTEKLISPSQAQKLLGKARYDEIENLVVKTSGSPSLAPDNDPRPAVKPDIADYFNVIEEKS